MKLYTFPPAPNPRRLNTHLGEKGIRIPAQLVNLAKGEHKRQEILAKNPLGALPFLELDDGTILTESFAIMEYLEDLHPEPPMIGRTPLARAELPAVLRILGDELGARPFLAGDRPTVADCTLFGTWEFGRMFGVAPDREVQDLHRWHESFLQRPSATWNPDPGAG